MTMHAVVPECVVWLSANFIYFVLSFASCLLLISFPSSVSTYRSIDVMHEVMLHF